MSLVKFMQSEDGVTAIEYGLIAALIAIALIVAMSTLGGSLGDGFTRLSGEVDKTL